nr:GntR family transcriptional regulator [Pseudomonas sp.]
MKTSGGKALSSPQRVADAITRGILLRRYVVGQRLIEADLMQELGVSRSTVREALKILGTKGVVQSVAHRGAVIRRLTLDEARNLLSVIEVLVGLAARLAASRIEEGQNREVFAAAAEPLVSPRPAGDLESILDQRARFYQAMLDIAGNDELNRALPSPQAHLFRTQFYGLASRADLRAMVNEYRNITKAILAGDVAKAEMHARRHIQKTAERTLPFIA